MGFQPERRTQFRDISGEPHAEFRRITFSHCLKLCLVATVALLVVYLAGAGFGQTSYRGATIVIVDDAVRNVEKLTEGMPDGTIVHRLPESGAGLDGIAEIASRYREIQSLHIISHGETGRLQLGGHEYDLGNIEQAGGTALAAIGRSLGRDADILFYGCDIAGGRSGQGFIDKIAALSGADVAASSDTTGHRAANGNWRLEIASGEIENDVLIAMEARQSWPHILANTTLVWDTRPYTNFLVGATDVVTIDSITITSSGTQTGTRTAQFHDIFPTYNYDGFTGLVASEFNATTDNGSVTNTTTFAFSEPVYNLTFTIIDVDGGPTLAFRDAIQFGSNTGAFPTATTGSNVSYNAGTGFGQAINAFCSTGAGNVPNCLLTPTFAGPVTSVTVQHIAAGANGTDPQYQIIVIDDLTFNTPPDATDNSNSTNESTAVSGNMITDDDGSGVDSDNQDAAGALVIQSVDGNAVPGAGLTINLPSGGTLTVQQDGSYTFDPNGGYETLGLGQSTVETFTYVLEDAEGLSNNDGSATDSVATLSITINGEADYDFAVTKIVDIANVSAAGTTLSYTITVTNTGDTGMTGVTPVDTLVQGASSTGLTLSGPTGDGGVIGTIEPAEVWTYTASHVVTQAQMDDGADLVNGVDVTTTQMGATTRSASATTTITRIRGLTVTKTADDTTDVVVGQVITYTYDVENTGNQTITNVSLSDAHGGSGPAPVPSNETLTTDNAPLGDSTDGGVNGTWDSIAPGDIVTFTATYTVTQSDVDTLQ